MAGPLKLETRIVDKPWGRRGIDPRFGADADRQIGEIWFEPPPAATLDVMAKYLFTTERLSIQVHPDDATAQARGQRAARTNAGSSSTSPTMPSLASARCARRARRKSSPRRSDGSIVDLIDWRKPAVGDFIYNPAGTIHALGPGLTVLEIQQAVDLTYRLFDYGRPRALHLDEARDVVMREPHHHRLDTKVGDTACCSSPGRISASRGASSEPPVLPQGMRDVQLLPIDAAVGGVGPGECALIDDHAARRLRSEGTFVLAWSLAS